MDFYRLSVLCMLVLLHLASREASTSSDPSSQISHVNITCDLSHHGECSLPIAYHDHLEVQSSVFIHINVAQLHLNVRANFSHLLDLTIKGEMLDSNTVVICSSNASAGFVFYNVSNITLSNLIISECGTAVVTSQVHTYYSAITVLYSRDVSLTNITITNSTGIGLMLYKLRGGLVQVQSSQFEKNVLWNHPEDQHVFGGGGVLIKDFSLEPVTIKFDDCEFKENVAHAHYFDHLYSKGQGQPVSGYGLGGGAAIYLEKGVTDVHVIFNSCTFTKNKAAKGAGLYVSIGEAQGPHTVQTRNVLQCEWKLQFLKRTVVTCQIYQLLEGE